MLKTASQWFKLYNEQPGLKDNNQVWDKGLVKQFALYLMVIFEIALPTIGGFVAGSYLDSYFSLYPILTITLSIGGVIFGFLSLMRLLKKIEEG